MARPTLRIDYVSQPEFEHLDTLKRGLEENAKMQMGFGPMEPFVFLCKMGERVVGGCNGYVLYGAVSIDQLWVDASARHQGIGQKLVQETEELAKKHKCKLLFLSTMSWEARDFYQKLGFEHYSSLGGFEKDTQMHHMKKYLDAL